MSAKRLAVGDLDEVRVHEFLDARRRRGRTCRGFRPTALLLLQQLRGVGAVPMPDLAHDDSPVAVLLARYEGYLRRERALEKCTIALKLSGKPFSIVRACDSTPVTSPP